MFGAGRETTMTAVVPDARTGRVSDAAPSGTTPLFTRHMRGAIEAERDRRLQERREGHRTFRYSSRAGTGQDTALPRPLAPASGNGPIVTQASPEVDRWIDEGGSYDAETVGRLRATRTRR